MKQTFLNWAHKNTNFTVLGFLKTQNILINERYVDISLAMVEFTELLSGLLSDNEIYGKKKVAQIFSAVVLNHRGLYDLFSDYDNRNSIYINDSEYIIFSLYEDIYKWLPTDFKRAYDISTGKLSKESSDIYNMMVKSINQLMYSHSSNFESLLSSIKEAQNNLIYRNRVTHHRHYTINKKVMDMYLGSYLEKIKE